MEQAVTAAIQWTVPAALAALAAALIDRKSVV